MTTLPRILVIDDITGRHIASGRNAERASMCRALRLKDARGDCPPIGDEIAEAVFIRGQRPAAASIGDSVSNDLDGAVEALRAGWRHRPPGAAPWALVLLDLRFMTGAVTAESEATFGPGIAEGSAGDASEYFGITLLRRLKRTLRPEFDELPVVLLSAEIEEPVLREYARLGAKGFVSRLDPNAAAQIAAYLARDGLVPDATGRIVGTSIALLETLRRARRIHLARDDALILGESGSGKELIARFIHHPTADKSERPFESINGALLDAELGRSELFGHTRGAFTNAIEDRVGAVQLASGGDFFLDECGHVPIGVQSQFLRMLEEPRDSRVIPRLGRPLAHPVDVRFIFATNDPSRIHSDVRYRLATSTIEVPSLSARQEDIPNLVEHFVRRAELRHGAPRRTIDDEVLSFLAQQDWAEGNVRDLARVVERAVADYQSVRVLTAAQLDQGMSKRTTAPSVPGASSQATDQLRGAWNAAVRDLLAVLRQGAESLASEQDGGDDGIHLGSLMALLRDSDDRDGARAADMLKRAFKLDDKFTHDIRNDSVLRRLHDLAVSKRGGSPLGPQ